MNGFTKRSERLVHQGAVVSFAAAEFTGPNGEVLHRDIIHHPGAVTICPLTDEGNVVLVRQFRAAMNDVVLELPAGKRDVPGEDLEDLARRELREEVGCVAEVLEPLIELAHSPGFCDEVNLLYLARGIRRVTREPIDIEEETMEIIEIPLAEAVEKVIVGEIFDATSVAALLLTWLRVRE